ncbi:hypothetical protein LCM10_03790 [Rossellomorea aquimaris]|uniref:hypothetical protein n=1 Tax=Rossellomorea aquimaris TaxID=189382 RepID=UPI001CD363BF|nr:hypothetical protein [Rossellomorea aquimaris]MCA1054097.1 hypothetical protein [Rossellomorea aquimaris]
MLKVKVKANDRRFYIPVPYALLYLGSLLISSKRINRLINKGIEKNGSKFVFPEIKRKDVKPLLDEFSKYRGLVLVETTTKDGTEVKIKL